MTTTNKSKIEYVPAKNKEDVGKQTHYIKCRSGRTELFYVGGFEQDQKWSPEMDDARLFDDILEAEEVCKEIIPFTAPIVLAREWDRKS